MFLDSDGDRVGRRGASAAIFVYLASQKHEGFLRSCFRRVDNYWNKEEGRPPDVEKADVSKSVRCNFRRLLAAADFALAVNNISLPNDVLIVVLTVVSQLGVYDFDLVGRMLDALFKVDGHFFNLFVDSLMGFEDIADEDARIAEYLLTIGAKKSYIINDSKVSLVDVPFMNMTLAGIALRRGRPEALRLFLRHGADPAAAASCLGVLRLDARRLPPRRLQSLLLLAAALPQPGPPLAALLPHLPRVSSLKHLSKVAVRSLLARAGYLPLGIYALRLPAELHLYLDLKADS